jgi:MFS family permease
MIRDRVLRVMTLAFALFAVAVGGILVAEIPLAASFGAGPTGYGLISVTFSVGALAGALGARVVGTSRERPALVAASFVTAAGLLAVAAAPTLAIVLVALLVAGASDGLVDVILAILFQRRSPDWVRSRVIAGLETTFLLGQGISLLFAGPLVDALGPKVAFAVAGSGGLATAVILTWLFGLRRASAEW